MSEPTRQSGTMPHHNGKNRKFLFLYPLFSWKHQLRTYMIHGHLHNDTRADFCPLIRNRDRVLNARVDINGFEPVTLEELIENNRKFKRNQV